MQRLSSTTNKNEDSRSEHDISLIIVQNPSGHSERRILREYIVFYSKRFPVILSYFLKITL